MPIITKGDNVRQNSYVAGGAVKIGDFVKLDASGRVVVAAAGDALLGVSNSYASAAGLPINVFDNPEQQFIGQASTAGIAALADLNLNYNIVANTTSGPEGNHQIDGASGATTATLPLKVLNLSPEFKAAFGSNARVVFVINNHILKGGTGTVGV